MIERVKKFGLVGFAMLILVTANVALVSWMLTKSILIEERVFADPKAGFVPGFDEKGFEEIKARLESSK